MIAYDIPARAAWRGARLCASLSCVVALLFATTTASAQTIVDSQGFESPFFDTTFGPGGPGTGTGQLEGQTPATFNGTWLRTKGPGLGTADVQTTIVESGNQAVKVTRVGGSDDRWGVPVSGYPAGDFICIMWDMYVEQTVGPANTFGPYLGMEAYDDDATSIGLLGSLGVDASTGDVLYQVAGSGILTETGSTVTFNAWHSFMVELNFATKTYEYFLDGALLGSEGFVDDANIVGGLNEFTDANISALAAAGDAASQALTGVAYFDNFTVVEGQCIPEPATWALAALGMTAAAVRRRVG